MLRWLIAMPRPDADADIAAADIAADAAA